MVRLIAWAGLVLAASLTACDIDNNPTPGASDAYDVVIAFCEEPLKEIRSFCDRVNSSSGDEIFANVLLGKAGGHDLVVRTQDADGGPSEESAPFHIPPKNEVLHVVRIEREGVCGGSPTCSIAVSAIVDGVVAAKAEFRFASS